MEGRYKDERAAEVLWKKGIYGLAFVELDGTILEVNPFFCALLEYTDSELVGKHFKDITHPDDITADQDQIDRLLHQYLDSYCMLKRYITKTNKVIWIKLKVDIIKKDGGGLELLFVQVAPAEYEGEAHILHEGQVIASPSDWFLGALKFLKNNWKIVAPVLSGVVSIIFFLYTQVTTLQHNFTTLQDKVSQNSALNRDLDDHVRTNQGKLDLIIQKLSENK